MKPMRLNSLEGRWDILYRDYPEIYDEWSQIEKTPDLIDVMVDRFPLQDKIVVDVGSGTGLSTFKLAKHAKFVIGVEIEKAMFSVAAENALRRKVENVRFELGDAGHLPLEDGTVDMAVGITLADQDVAKDAAEMERVVRPGGLVLRVDVAPGWYGGDVFRIVSGEPVEEATPGSRDAVLTGLGYDFMDVFMDQEYETVERVVRTYGFIHSARVINYVREHGITKIHWKFRARYKQVE